MMDSKGLITSERSGLAEHKPFERVILYRVASKYFLLEDWRCHLSFLLMAHVSSPVTIHSSTSVWQARKGIFMMDSKGLITSARSEEAHNLAEHKRPFAHHAPGYTRWIYFFPKLTDLYRKPGGST